MKRTVLTLAVVIAMLAVVFAVGPRVSVDQTLRPVVLPEDLDGYLARSEARFADLRPGVEKTIIWADSSKAKTPIALVYLHGFSATRQETRPLCDTLAARLGANLFYTRLRGHGRSDDAMAEASANDWLNDSYEALAIGRRLGERVVLVGTSTGATPAAWLATPPAVRGQADPPAWSMYLKPPSGFWHRRTYSTARSIVCLGTLMPALRAERRAMI